MYPLKVDDFQHFLFYASLLQAVFFWGGVGGPCVSFKGRLRACSLFMLFASRQLMVYGQGCSSVDCQIRCAADADLTPWCSKRFFPQSNVHDPHGHCGVKVA